MINISLENLSEQQKENLRIIKKAFRQSMNADLSNSMRRLGFDYNIIFGVPAPRIQLISSSFSTDKELALYLWNEKIRESKIIATYLLPKDENDDKFVRDLISEIQYTEIADQLSRNFLITLPFVKSILADIISSDNKMERYTAMRLFSLLLQRNEYETLELDTIFEEIKNNVVSNVSYLKSVSVNIADLIFDAEGQILGKARLFFDKFEKNEDETLKSFRSLLY